MNTGLCRQCGTVITQRNRLLLAGCGALMCCAPLVALEASVFWVPALIALYAGAYLIVWATLGNGRWCRHCKTFRV